MTNRSVASIKEDLHVEARVIGIKSMFYTAKHTTIRAMKLQLPVLLKHLFLPTFCAPRGSYSRARGQLLDFMSEHWRLRIATRLGMRSAGEHQTREHISTNKKRKEQIGQPSKSVIISHSRKINYMNRNSGMQKNP